MNTERLPPGWTVERLSEACCKTPLTNPGKNPNQAFNYVDVSSVSNETYRIIETKRLLGRDAPSRARKQIERDDVLFATVRPTLRRIAMVPQSLDGQVCSTGFCVLRAERQRLQPAFLYFYLLTEQVEQRVDVLQKGATYPAINDSDLLDLRIPLPPLSEQRAIAHALRTVQQAIEARRRELELERERKAALMQHLFTYGTRGEPLKQTEIGEMPKSWQVVEAENVCTRVVDCPHSTPTFLPSGVLVIRNVNVREGRLNLRPCFFTSEEEYLERIRRCEPQAGDVLFSREAPIGEACLVPQNTRLSLGQRMMLLRANSQILDSYFLVQAFYSTEIRKRMLSLASGVTAKHLNVADVKRLRIPLPSLTEQLAIAEALKSCEAKIVALEGETDLLKELFKAMLEELMTGRLSAVPLIEEGNQ